MARLKSLVYVLRANIAALLAQGAPDPREVPAPARLLRPRTLPTGQSLAPAAAPPAAASSAWTSPTRPCRRAPRHRKQHPVAVANSFDPLDSDLDAGDTDTIGVHPCDYDAYCLGSQGYNESDVSNPFLSETSYAESSREPDAGQHATLVKTSPPHTQREESYQDMHSNSAELNVNSNSHKEYVDRMKIGPNHVFNNNKPPENLCSSSTGHAQASSEAADEHALHRIDILREQLWDEADKVEEDERNGDPANYAVLSRLMKQLESLGYDGPSFRPVAK